MKPVKIHPGELDYRNPFLEIRRTRADFGNFSKDYYVVELGMRAGLVAARGKEILLARQYRFLIDRMSWEIPGGTVEAGESPAQAAVRECQEETGVTCRNLQPLVVYYPGLDSFNNRTTLFYSMDVETTSEFVSDPGEVTDIAWTPLETCIEMARSGEILDALTVTGLLAFECFARRKPTSL